MVDAFDVVYGAFAITEYVERFYIGVLGVEVRDFLKCVFYASEFGYLGVVCFYSALEGFYVCIGEEFSYYCAVASMFLFVLGAGLLGLLLLLLVASSSRTEPSTCIIMPWSVLIRFLVYLSASFFWLSVLVEAAPIPRL